MSVNVSKKTEKKSLKKPQSKPYIVTHWHATLNTHWHATLNTHWHATLNKSSKKVDLGDKIYGLNVTGPSTLRAE